MAESKSTVAAVPLNDANYATWRVLSVMKEGLWGIVKGTCERLELIIIIIFVISMIFVWEIR